MVNGEIGFACHVCIIGLIDESNLGDWGAHQGNQDDRPFELATQSDLLASAFVCAKNLLCLFPLIFFYVLWVMPKLNQLLKFWIFDIRCINLDNIFYMLKLNCEWAQFFLNFFSNNASNQALISFSIFWTIKVFHLLVSALNYIILIYEKKKSLSEGFPRC